ncbi:hypothetical protein [Chryseobacterium indoltheticum]|uniref:hypothetical protein n=1 Tax=Chryseobacterium indoltheticum TaxID=254 RepID=UPI003F4913AB
MKNTVTLLQKNSKQYFVEDLAKQTFSIEIKNMPGQKYEYQSVSAQLLGMALTKNNGETFIRLYFRKNMETIRNGISC